jgi:hypothetical protein
MLKISSDRIITQNYLEYSSLRKLFSNEILALRIPNYCQADICNKIADILIAKQSDLECYHHEIKNGSSIKYLDYGVDRLGKSFNTTYFSDTKQRQEYYENALRIIRFIRNIVPGQLSPVDQFRLELDEVWPGEVGLGNFERRKMFAGIPRVMSRPKDAKPIASQPHIDFLPKKYADIVGQYAMNIYIRVPEEGGDLELWDIPPLTHEESQKLEFCSDWRSQLPSSQVFSPSIGELIIFNSRCPHAVKMFGGGTRITLQSFIGLTITDRLLLWS